MIDFRISSFCDIGGCVEVGRTPDGAVLVRDSKDDDRAVTLWFPDTGWAAFLRGLKAGDFTA